MQMNNQPQTLCPCPVFFPQAALARRVPWPQMYASAPLNPGLCELHTIYGAKGGSGVSAASGASDATAPSSASLPCVRLGFALWYLPADQAQALLRLALETAQLVLVADFKLAERNLELPATLAARGVMKLTGMLARILYGARKYTPTEAQAGRAAQTDFMQRGGIEGLVYRGGTLVHERRPIFAGAAALLHLQRS